MQNLNSLPDHALRREFIEGINLLREKIMAKTGPKTYADRLVTGIELAGMIESYVEAFNSGKVPNIKTAWQQISEDQGKEAYLKAI